MINVLFCTPYLQTPEVVSGGIGIWANNIINHHHKVNSNINLIPVSFDRKYDVTETDGAIKRLYHGVKDYWNCIRNAFERIDEGGVDVLHLCTSAQLSLYKDFYILKKARKKGVKTAIHFHFGRIPEIVEANNREGKMVLKVCKAADTVIVMDKRSYLCLVAKGFTNVYCLPNPLSEHIIDEINAESGLVKRINNKVLFVGHVIVTKGVYELVKACLDISGIELHIVGTVEDSIKADLLAIANERDGGSWMKLRGAMPHSEVIKEMLSAGVFVLPTYTEGFPNVILESMVASCAILSTGVGAIPEMLDFGTDHACGVELKLKSIKSIKENINKLLGDKCAVEALGKKAKEKVINTYSMPIIWNQLSEIWTKTALL